MDINESLEKLFALKTFGVKLGLDNIHSFLDQLGSPHQKLELFHVAGSNGKGSTTSFLASILIEHGYKVGIYTSPHFVKFNERIKIGNEEIPDAFVSDFINKHFAYIMHHGLTFFEVTTAMAFDYFLKSKVDYAVIETGLGGRLDATNVFTPLASIITSISLEHTAILGDTLTKIAFEKAEIIKNNSIAISGFVDQEALEVIRKKADNVSATLFCLHDFFNLELNLLNLNNYVLDFNKLQLPLRGRYQIYNASLAVIAVKSIFSDVKPNLIEKGLANVILNTNFSGRYEYVSKHPDIILDSAHNLEGITFFLTEFKKDVSRYSSRTLLFTALKDKSIAEMLTMLKDSFTEFVFTEVEYERKTPAEDLLDIASNIGIKGTLTKDPIDFVLHFKKTKTSSDCLVILGSMYLLGTIKGAKPEDFA